MQLPVGKIKFSFRYTSLPRAYCVTSLNTSLPTEKDSDSLWKDILLSLKTELNLLEKHLALTIKENIPYMQEIGEQLLLAGGKRVRPILLFLTAHLNGYKGEALTPLASALELIHTATLLHDDVIDESPTRRGVPTAHMLWGNKASILVGDYLFSKAFTCMVQANSLEVMQTLSKASQRIARGELLELKELHFLHLSLESYLEIIEEKTAALFQAACEVGAILGNLSQAEKKRLSLYGSCFGLLFQIKDDLLDYIGDPKKIGKTTGSDFREKKVTLPIILAYQHASAEEKNFWEEAFSEKDHSQDSFTKAKEILEKRMIPSLIEEYMKSYQKEALDCLSSFSHSKEKELLTNLIYLSSFRAF